MLPPFAPAQPAFARLTVAQYSNVIRDLLGAAIKVPELEADTRPYLFSVIGASTTTISLSSRAFDVRYREGRA